MVILFAILVVPAVLLVPIVPSTFNAGVTIKCASTPFPCTWVTSNRVPAQGSATYHVVSSLANYAIGVGMSCSSDIGGCWFDT